MLQFVHSTDNTTIVENNQIATAKDIAINGNLEDLASARGYLVDEYLPEFPSRTVLSSFDDATTPGNFHVLWNNTTTSAPDGILNKNQYADGVLEVRDNRSASFVSSFARLMQRLTIIGGATRADSARIFVRTQSWGASREWFPWVELVSYNKFGDGFRNTNGIISVPEYDGATASTTGTSGLVPPATTDQTDFVLCGDGKWKDISKIAAHAAGPSNKTITITLTGTSTTYTAPETGWISYRAISETANSWISLTIETTTLYAVDRPISNNSNIALNLPISKGQKATINCASNVTFTSREAHFIYTNGSVPA